MSLGGQSKVQNHSVALGADYTISSSTVFDIRFGFFKYGVDVLPNDFGTNPATEAGIPGLNLGDDFTSGLPLIEINGGTEQMRFGSGLDSAAAIARSRRREAGADRGQPDQALRHHTVKFGVESAARTTSGCRATRTARDSSTSTPRAPGSHGGGLGLATFLGDVQRMIRFVSPNTTRASGSGATSTRAGYLARHLQADPQLRPARGHPEPQTVNEPGNGAGWTSTRVRSGWAGGGHRPRRQRREHDQLGPAARRHVPDQPKTVIRAGTGAATTSGLRSTFGHTVTQNLPVLAIRS